MMHMEKYVITMLGEKDHGKSTLIGNLLISTGSTTEARINEVKKSAKAGRFEPAHILDSFVEEREKEMTIDTTRAEIVYKKAILELIDVPGHLELIKNMMSGASNSDIAILMVSIKKNEGFKPQTKRHIFLSGMFGVKALVVAINKIDVANYSKDAFDAAKKEISDYLESINFGRPVVYIPISAYNNENLVSLSKNTTWYKGKPLIDTVREFAEKYSKDAKSANGLRIFVQDSMDLNGEKTVFGLLYNGTARTNETIRIEPQNSLVKIEKMYVKGKKVTTAARGTNLALVLDRELDVPKGSVIYGKDHYPHKKGTFSAKMFIIKPINAKNTKNLTIKISNNNISLRKLQVKKLFSPVSGLYAKPSATVAANSVVYADVTLGRPYPVEKFENYSELGRFGIYDKENFIGVGIIE